jgi:hypothetical protein
MLELARDFTSEIISGTSKNPYNMKAVNCYSFHSLLIVHNPGGMPTFMFSKEGVTQGDPIAMFCYGIGILLMIRQLKVLYPALKQPWYADDAEALGRVL